MTGILIWDCNGSPAPGDKEVILWRDYNDSGVAGHVSLPKWVEKHSRYLRSCYLDWVFHLGEHEIEGSTVADHLRLPGKASYWWLTRIAEKCNFTKSTYIDEIIKLLGLRHWLDGRTGIIDLVSDRPAFCKLFSLWASHNGLEVSVEQSPGSESRATITAETWQGKSFLYALAWLGRYVWHRRTLRNRGIEAWKNAPEGRLFVSYLDNVRDPAKSGGQFQSDYWWRLPQLLAEKKIASNWLHLYEESPVLASPAAAAEFIDSLNRTNSGQCHVTLDSFLGTKVILTTLRDWIRLRRKSAFLSRPLQSYERFGIPFTLFHVDDWQRSTMGVSALEALLQWNLVDRAMAVLRIQPSGYYLMENQPWEMALQYSWRGHGHGRLTGVAHSTVRSWDLRYFCDPDIFHQEGDATMPLPDQVAVNGEMAMSSLVEGGWPREKLVETEALRFMYLNKVKYTPKTKIGGDGLKILVLTDYVREYTDKQISMMAEAAAKMPGVARFTIRDHPNTPLSEHDLDKIQGSTLAKEGLAELLSDHDLVVSSNVTSAAVDAYSLGLPVIVLLNKGQLNLSPLKDCRDVTFVANADELVQAINTIVLENGLTKREAFFNLQPDLERWETLLA
jgi:surface carbohydrate biosynthesis protein (TIGR04326 family)